MAKKILLYEGVSTVLSIDINAGTKYKEMEFWDQNVIQINTFSDNTGYMVYNLNADVLFEDLDTSISNGMELIVVGNDSSILYTNNNGVQDLHKQIADKLTKNLISNNIISFSDRGSI